MRDGVLRVAATTKNAARCAASGHFTKPSMLDAYLAEMLAACHIFKCRAQLFEREYPVDHRLDIVQGVLFGVGPR